MKRPTHDQLRAEGRNAERKRVMYLVEQFLAGKISPVRFIFRLSCVDHRC